MHTVFSVQSFSSVHSLHIDITCCSAITPADTNCTSEWVQRNNTSSYGGKLHVRASSLTECQKACEFDPRCVAADWLSQRQECWINPNTNHTHYTPSIHSHFSEEDDRYAAHYELRRRCDIASAGKFYGLFENV